MINKKNIYMSALISFMLVGCGSCGSCEDEAITDSNTTITVERGPVIESVVRDVNGKLATNITGTNKYVFTGEYQYPISATGGWIDVDQDSKKTGLDILLEKELTSYQENITPLTTMLSNADASKRTELENIFIKEFGVERNELYTTVSESSQKIMVLNNTIYKNAIENNSSISELYSFNNLNNSSLYYNLITDYFELNKVVNDNFLENGLPNAIQIEKYIIDSNNTLYSKVLEQDEETFEPNNILNNSYYIEFDKNYNSTLGAEDNIDYFKINVEAGQDVFISLDQNNSNYDDIPLEITFSNNENYIETETDKDIYLTSEDIAAELTNNIKLYKNSKMLYKVKPLETGTLEIKIETPHSVGDSNTMYSDTFNYNLNISNDNLTNDFVDLSEEINKGIIYNKSVFGKVIIIDDNNFYTNNDNTNDWLFINNLDDNDTISINLSPKNINNADNTFKIDILDDNFVNMYSSTKDAYDTNITIPFDYNISKVYINLSSTYNSYENNYSIQIQD